MADPSKEDLLKDKFQTVVIKFTNGATGLFIGRAVISEEDSGKIGIADIKFLPPEDATDEIRKKISNYEKGKESE